MAEEIRDLPEKGAPGSTIAYAGVHPVIAGLRQRCPRCGTGKLYEGLLSVRAECPDCALDLSEVDAGDGPAVFVILILGFVVVALAFWVEFTFEPPYWLHAVLWTPLIFGGAIFLLGRFKGILIALQFQTQAREGRLVEHSE
ncbi:MAG: DUF983 domain-containing protein [Alphaproteobacteria bacterium]